MTKRMTRDSGTSDAAAADLVGTVLTLAVTMTLLTGVGYALLAQGEPQIEPLGLSFVPATRVGASEVTLLHVGGETVPVERLRAIVSVNGSVWFDGPPTANASGWRLGEHAVLSPLLDVVPPDAQVEVTLVDRGLGEMLRTHTLRLGGAAEEAAGVEGGWPAPSVEVMLDGGGNNTSVVAPATVRVEARVQYDGGRARIAEVVADARTIGGGDWVQLRDDGLAGDAVARDGVYTTFLRVPEGTASEQEPLLVTAVALDGSIGTAEGLVYIDTAGAGFYNTELIKRIGHRIFKFSGSTGNGDAVTVHLKIKLDKDPYTLTDEAGASVGEYTLSRAFVYYDPVKPGNKPAYFQLDWNAAATSDGWICASGSTTLFKEENVTISHYKKNRDTFRYYFELEWKKVSGSGDTVFREPIEASETVQYFLLRRSEDFKEVLDGGWPQQFDDCS